MCEGRGAVPANYQKVALRSMGSLVIRLPDLRGFFGRIPGNLPCYIPAFHVSITNYDLGNNKICGKPPP